MARQARARCSRPSSSSESKGCSSRGPVEAWCLACRRRGSGARSRCRSPGGWTRCRGLGQRVEGLHSELMRRRSGSWITSKPMWVACKVPVLHPARRPPRSTSAWCHCASRAGCLLPAHLACCWHGCPGLRSTRASKVSVASRAPLSWCGRAGPGRRGGSSAGGRRRRGRGRGARWGAAAGGRRNLACPWQLMLPLPEAEGRLRRWSNSRTGLAHRLRPLHLLPLVVLPPLLVGRL